jgi:Ca2+-transporting ATPase
MQTPHARSIDEVLDALSVEADRGLDPQEAKRRRKEHGPNVLREARRASAWKILVEQFENLVIGILAVAAALSVVMGEYVQAGAVLAAILVNAAIGFFTEWKAVRSMEALRSMGTTKTRVRRGGRLEEVDAKQLVPGDLVLLEAGDVVSADLRLVEANGLTLDESALTGESVPVSKTTEPVKEDAPLAERTPLAFKGTAATGGSGLGVVVATGMRTEIGNIAEMAESAEESATPLEKRLDRLARRLIVLTLLVAAVVGVAGWLGGKDLVTMITTAVALAVAAVPEGLPIVATVALARGMWRMARRNALVERLAAVETLGSTNVVFTDKTGTLTENRMRVAALQLPESEPIDWRPEERPDARAEELPEAGRRLMEVAVLCNNASLGEAEDESEAIAGGTGDPMEIALLAGGRGAGLERDALLGDQPEEREVSFDTDTKMMATVHAVEDGYRFAVKGAPEAVLQAASRVFSEDGPVELEEADREDWSRSVGEMAAEGLRILAFAEKTDGDAEAEPYENLTLLGLVGLADPPRADAADAVAECREAGIRVVMVTGDQPATAAAIARQVGLGTTDDDAEVEAVAGRDLPDLDSLSEEEHESLRRRRVFARVSPAQKLDLIRLYQETGAVVAMTGDGVNDAPALKKADVGIAMGQRGTDVAREASDIVLKDDAFPTIVAAIEQGRAIFDNIRRFIVFLLSGNLAEILAVGTAAALAAPLPLLPLQILFINLVLDVFPALALGVCEGAPGLMKRRPRDPQEPVLTRRHWIGTFLWGVLIAVSVGAVFAVALYWLRLPAEQAVTLSFVCFALARLWHVFNMRDLSAGAIRNEVTTNKYVWWAILICLALIGAAVYLPGLNTILSLSPPDATGWGLILAGSVAPLLVGQTVLFVMGLRRGAEGGARDAAPAAEGKEQEA